MSLAPTRLLDALGERPPGGGRVESVRGITVEAIGVSLPVGAVAEIETQSGFVTAEVVGFRDDRLQLMPLGSMRGIAGGSCVWPVSSAASIPAGDWMLGRVVDATGRPLDDGPPAPPGCATPLYREPMPPLDRPPLSEPLDAGVRAINAATTLARGQRIGIFSGPGVGKSTLLGMMVRGTDADVRVVGLIGERGREVREFIEREVGDAGRRTVVVAVPADAPPLLRARGAHVATAVAEYFRDSGRDVLLVMDSVTRFAMAAREIGLARGEPATTKGYTPSVFAELPALLERAGATERGSITGLYTVLVEGSDLDDPIADALRAILDGHLVLARDLAERGHYPAIDVLGSISRAMPVAAAAEHQALASRMRALLAAYRDAEDLIQVGAYAAGSDPMVDEAIARRSAIDSFLCQGIREIVPLGASIAQLEAMFAVPGERGAEVAA